MQNANLYVWTCLDSQEKCDTLKDVMDYYNVPKNSIWLSVDDSYSPKKRNITKKQPQNLSSTIKIRMYIKNKMKMLSESGYTFTNDMLHALTSKELTKSVVGNNFALLVTDEEYNSGKVDKSKYWNDIMKFNGKMYHVTSQWFEYQRDGFDKWYKSLK